MMDHLGPIPAVLGPPEKSIVVSAIALTFFDYMLLFEDEVRYVWKGRKTWIFYLYILNRMLLLGYQLWQLVYTIISNSKDSSNVKDPSLIPKHPPQHMPPAGLYIQLILIMFFLFSSDIFVTLRIYAITLGNKVLVAYFGMLAFARFGLAFSTAFVGSSSTAVPLQLRLVPNTIGTTFEVSAFLVIAFYVNRNRGTLRLSALLYRIAAESTVYFLAMVAAQIYIQMSFNLTKGPPISVLAYGLFNPILTLRFAISLRKSADPNGGQQWEVTHFNTPHFARVVSPDSRVSTIHENIEMDTIYHPHRPAQVWEQ